MHTRVKHAENSTSGNGASRVWILLLALVLGVWVPPLSYWAWQSWRDNQTDVLPSIDLALGHDFIYDQGQLKPGQAVWFTYPVGPERVRFALQRDSAGTVRTVVASCTVCYSSREGEEFKNGRLICARCREAMRLGDQGEKMTLAKGCVAVPVPFSADGKLLTVQAADMEERLRDLNKTSASKE